MHFLLERGWRWEKRKSLNTYKITLIPAGLDLILVPVSGNRSCRHLLGFSGFHPPGPTFVCMFVSSFHPRTKSYEQNWVMINDSGCGEKLRPKLPMRVKKRKKIIGKKIPPIKYSSHSNGLLRATQNSISFLSSVCLVDDHRNQSSGEKLHSLGSCRLHWLV